MLPLTYLRSGAAVVALASLLPVGSASASSLQFDIVGGDQFTLLSNFNPNWASAPSGIGSGTSIDIFYSTNASSGALNFNSPTTSGAGLKVEYATAPVTLTYTFLGFEAAYTNIATDAFSLPGGTFTFTNQTSAIGSSSSLTNQGNGLVPFSFNSAGGGYSQADGTAANGGPIGQYVAIGFFVDQSNSAIAYAFLEDIWQGGDADFDDMVVQISASQSPGADIGRPTPLPAAFPLFATGLGAMGLLGWRRKRKRPAVAIAAA
jgi:hypothetical protein